MSKKSYSREFKKCYHAESGKTKSLAPSVYNNPKMMQRLGWAILPDVEAPQKPPSNATDTKEVRNVQQPTAAKTPETVAQPKTDNGLPQEPKPKTSTGTATTTGGANNVPPPAPGTPKPGAAKQKPKPGAAAKAPAGKRKPQKQA